MRVAWTSDLHVDQNRGIAELIADRLAVLRPEVAILAGDLTHALEPLEHTLATIAAGARAGGARATLYVAGNHDLWVDPRTGGSSRAKLANDLPAACARAGVRMLAPGAEPLLLDDAGGAVAFCGVPGWYDYSLRATWLDGEVTLAQYERKRRGRLVWQDVNFFRWPAGDADDGPGGATAGPLEPDAAVAALMERALAAQLDAVRGRAARTVVVTHFLPFEELVLVRQHPLWDFLNAYMGSRGLGAVIAAAPEVVLAISGHTHIRREARIPRAGGGTLLAATSPIGYPRERQCTLAERVVDRVRVVDV